MTDYDILPALLNKLPNTSVKVWESSPGEGLLLSVSVTDPHTVPVDLWFNPDKSLGSIKAEGNEL